MCVRVRGKWICERSRMSNRSPLICVLDVYFVYKYRHDGAALRKMKKKKIMEERLGTAMYKFRWKYELFCAPFWFRCFNFQYGYNRCVCCVVAVPRILCVHILVFASFFSCTQQWIAFQVSCSERPRLHTTSLHFFVHSVNQIVVVCITLLHWAFLLVSAYTAYSPCTECRDIVAMQHGNYILYLRQIYLAREWHNACRK